MKTESAVPAIVLVCSFVQIILGISFFIDYELLMQFGLTGITVTALMFVSLSFLNRRSKSKGQVWDERFRTRYYSFIGLAFGITNKDDKQFVIKKIQELIHGGVYSSPLFQ